MNNAEASRTIAVLDELVLGLRLLSCITPESLDHNELLLEILDEDTYDLLQATINDPTRDELKAALHAAWRDLKKADLAHVTQLQEQVKLSSSMQQLLVTFDKVRTYTAKRLGTTVEEDAGNRAMQAEVQERLARANTEQVQQGHRLELQRAERAKESQEKFAERTKLENEKKDLQNSTQKHNEGLQQAACGERRVDNTSYEEQRAVLEKQVESAQQELAKFRTDAAAKESQLRKERRRAHNEMEQCIGEYDTDVGQKEKALLTAQAGHAEVLDGLHKVSTEFSTLKKERLEAEERERQAAAARLKAQIKQARMDAAAYLIQNAWKGYKKKKTDAAKTSKGKGKKGGKGDKKKK